MLYMIYVLNIMSKHDGLRLLHTDKIASNIVEHIIGINYQIGLKWKHLILYLGKH